MFLRTVTRFGAALALFVTTNAAHAAVVGTGAIDIAAELVLTDIDVEIDPDDGGPLSANSFGTGATVTLDFAYALDLPSGPADYQIDLRLSATSLRAIFDNPFPVGPDFYVISLLDSLSVTGPVTLFDTTLFLADLTLVELAGLSPIDTILNILAANSGSFALSLPSFGSVPAGLATGGYALDPGATPASGSGSANLRYDVDGLFAALRQPLLAELPDPLLQAVQGSALYQTGFFDTFQGMEGSFTLDIDISAVAPVPLPAGILLLPAALGAVVAVARRRRPRV